MPLGLLNLEILGTLASKAPNLSTLAILSEYSKGYGPRRTNRLLLGSCISLVSEISTSPALEWKLCDFGIIVREQGYVCIAPILPLIPLLRVILSKIPSITSFYGTGSLDLWEGMQSEIDESWGGELWRQRY
ncbi:hypothetical protein DL96DRAFT_1822656, partial [Flagelloscypha sp. PMI_526]